jgi:cobalt-zinc-cadmium efflux system protein
VHGVVGIHDLHIWALNMGNCSLSCHIKTTNPMVTLKKATRMLNTKFKILHTTIQTEYVTLNEHGDNGGIKAFICEDHFQHD